MSDTPEFRDLVGDDLTPEEELELARVDSLLRSVPGPATEVPGSLTRAVDDRVARDGVEPGGGRPPFGLVALRRAPDGGEGLLRRVFGPAVVAELPQGHREDRSGEALVELLEGLAVSAPDSLDQKAVVLGCGHCRRHNARRYGFRAPMD